MIIRFYIDAVSHRVIAQVTAFCDIKVFLQDSLKPLQDSAIHMFRSHSRKVKSALRGARSWKTTAHVTPDALWLVRLICHSELLSYTWLLDVGVGGVYIHLNAIMSIISLITDSGITGLLLSACWQIPLSGFWLKPSLHVLNYLHCHKHQRQRRVQREYLHLTKSVKFIYTANDCTSTK